MNDMKKLSPNQLIDKLFDAILDKDLKTIQETIDNGVDINYLQVFSGNITMCPLMVCVNKNYVDCAKLLIENGADVNNMSGALVRTAIYQKRHNILELLFINNAQLLASESQILYGLFSDEKTVEIILNYHDVANNILDYTKEKEDTKHIYSFVKNYIEKKKLHDELNTQLNEHKEVKTNKVKNKI